jgi:copper chaperone CopZ
MSKFALIGAAVLLGAGAWYSTHQREIQRVGGSTAAVGATAGSEAALATLAISGMTCGSCATTARLALQRVPGVYRAEVSYDSASAVVRYDAARTSPAQFIEQLEQMTGYRAQVAASAATAAGQDGR